MIEADLEFTPEFESAIQQSERECYLLRSPANARRLLAATRQLAAGKGKARKVNLDS